MSIYIHDFESLCQRYSTWEDLRPFLESTEGGGLRVVPQDVSGGKYVILRYNRKNIVDISGTACLSGITGLFRSVVWDTVKNRPVCMAPPKAHEGLPPLAVPLAATEDFIDGFMINVYMNEAEVGASADCGITTRTQIGGANTFYSNKTFAELFTEALATTPFKTYAALINALGEYRRSVSGAASAFVSFVVQHPEHRVVVKPTSPALYAVHMGTVNVSGLVALAEKPSTWPQQFSRLQIPSYSTRMFQTEKEVQDLLQKTAIQRGWRWQGLVFKDGSGSRWRLRTSTYNLLRELRGAESKPVERFMRLRMEGKISEYLKHYGEEDKTFWKFEEKLRERTMDLVKAYSDVHKLHRVEFKNLPAAYRPAVYMLHLEWLNNLRIKGYKVRLQNAIAVVNGLRTFEKIRLLEADPYVAAAAPAPAPAPSDSHSD